MGPYCALWLYGVGVPLAPCFGPWWAWGGASLHGVAWWGPWVEVPAGRGAGGVGGAGAGGVPAGARSLPVGTAGMAGPARSAPITAGFRGGVPTTGPGTPFSVLTGGLPITPGFTGGTGAGAGTNPGGAPEAGGAPIE